MILNELGPDRGPIPDLADQYAVSLIGATADEAVPQGVPLTAVDLPSLDNARVRTWLGDNRDLQVFVVAGREMGTEGTPELAVYVTEAEYKLVASAMPR